MYGINREVKNPALGIFGVPSTTLVRQPSQHPIRPAVPAKGRRVVTWVVPVGVHTLLGDALSGGLVWLLGVKRPGDALAIVLRRAMAIDAEEIE